ncbi:DUF4999 domain-containing protein [uncultured Tenacibaculum sp.]|uniref:DUF4999 domain-containing protein n=1 Tax=uncultured Tenacibaculum sp. TaxID=174713 RepID=UPI00260938BE|nr:DUF4999 domain-containing protein [uncultured Tenacibaculum sp.]
MKNFKYLLIMIIVFSISLVSCSDDNENDHDYHLEYVSVVNAELPNEFNYGSIHQINLTVLLPNSCYYYYNQLDYIYEGNTRLIYPIAHVDDGDSCNLSINETTFSIPVRVLQIEPYVFKFYQGKDSNGKDKFLIIEVPVNSSNKKYTENLSIETSDIVYE